MGEPFNLRLIQRGHGPTLFVSGDVDLFTAPALRECLLSLVGQHITLDFADVTFVDSCGANVLILTHVRSQQNGGSLTVRNVRATQKRVFELTGLTEVLDLRPLEP
jgi:anti-sigma B factor antagonist